MTQIYKIYLIYKSYIVKNIIFLNAMRFRKVYSIHF